MAKILFLVNDLGFLLSHRREILLQARLAGHEVTVGWGSATAADLAHASRLGVESRRVEMSRRGMNPVADARCFLRILQLTRLNRPDIVHAVTLKPVVYGGLAACLLGTRGLVLAIAGLGYAFGDASDLRRTVARSAMQLMLRLALRHPNVTLIVQNSSDRERMRRLGGATDGRIVLIPGSGVDLRAFRPAPTPRGVPVVGMASRLLGDKGVREFVRAAEILRARGAAARFVLAGSPDPGNPSSITPSELAQWQAQGIVEYAGFQEDVAGFYAKSNLVVFPSYYGEGLPKTLIEAAACGRAIVTTDVPGCRESVVPGVTGEVVPPRDASALANAVERLLADPDRILTMGTAARRFAEQTFDVQAVVNRHLEIYDSLLQSAPSSVP